MMAGMSTDLEQFVATGREMVRNALEQFAGKQANGHELTIADHRQCQSLGRLSRNLDALAAGAELPHTPEDEHARDIALAQIDRVEALGDKATTKDFATLREATRLLHEIERRDARRAGRKPSRLTNGAVEPSELARRLLDVNGHDEP
jgi:hypothetical protein